MSPSDSNQMDDTHSSSSTDNSDEPPPSPSKLTGRHNDFQVEEETDSAIRAV